MNDKLKIRGLKELLDDKVKSFNQPSFIVNDPISVPHKFSLLQDIEIMGLWTAVLAWGQRRTIINKANEIISLMDHQPYDFILNHKETDLKKFMSFKHRTFNTTDTLYFIHFFRSFYLQHSSLENAFLCSDYGEMNNTKDMLIHFHNTFFSLENFPHRTKKHLPTPESKSTCKRINMFLRWMVRNDGKGVDFGLWKKIRPHQLICPLDVHVDRVARKLNLIQRKQTDWLAAIELTENLKLFDAKDPVKYDFALFGMSAMEKWHDIV